MPTRIRRSRRNRQKVGSRVTLAITALALIALVDGEPDLRDCWWAWRRWFTR